MLCTTFGNNNVGSTEVQSQYDTTTQIWPTVESGTTSTVVGPYHRATENVQKWKKK